MNSEEKIFNMINAIDKTEIKLDEIDPNQSMRLLRSDKQPVRGLLKKTASRKERINKLFHEMSEEERMNCIYRVKNMHLRSDTANWALRNMIPLINNKENLRLCLSFLITDSFAETRGMKDLISKICDDIGDFWAVYRTYVNEGVTPPADVLEQVEASHLQARRENFKIEEKRERMFNVLHSLNRDMLFVSNIPDIIKIVEKSGETLLPELKNELVDYVSRCEQAYFESIKINEEQSSKSL